MKKVGPVLIVLFLMVFFSVSAHAVSLYVDAAPNVYGSPDYPAWEAAAFDAVSNGTFVNMASSVNPANVGTTEFEIEDEVVYSFGDLGRRLTFFYWLPETTVDEVTGRFEISLENIWDGDYLDFYQYYYGQTWLEPTKWVNYNGGVIGTAGMAWWGAYQVNTQDALDADIAEWAKAEETWIFSAKLDDEITSITAHRGPRPVPEPSTWIMLILGMVGLYSVRKKGLKK